MAGYDMPILRGCDIVPQSLVAFNAALTTNKYNQCVHFYIDDYQFERVWTKPLRYVPCLNKFQCVIPPDFSQFIDMPYPQRLWNNYRGKFIGALLETQGIKVIPNVTWSLPDSYDYCFEGIPQRTIIGINSMGAARYGLSRYLWIKGYHEMIERLHPEVIIRYGDKMPGEDTSISIYFHNERMLNLR